MKNSIILMMFTLLLTSCTKENIKKMQDFEIGDKLSISVPLRSLIKFPELKSKAGRATKEELDMMRPVDRKLHLIAEKTVEVSNQEYSGPSDRKEKRKFLLKRSLDVNLLQLRYRMIVENEAPEYKKYQLGMTMESLRKTRKMLTKQLSELESK